jgi:SAM-dependent methyltransferase
LQNLAKYTVRLPENVSGLAQHEEYVIVSWGGQERHIRLHDYREIYKVPGLYQRILADMLQCDSPEVLASLLTDQLSRAQVAPADLAVLELGAGTGMVGEALQRKGIAKIFGIDIIPEAAEAANRDRPGTYTRYYVEDMCNLSPHTRRELESSELNCMVCASALGLHHVPPRVFAHAFNVIGKNGWVVFNVNKNYLENRDATGFTAFINRVIEEGRLEISVHHPYQHRLSVDGSPILYVAMVGRKRDAIPLDMFT